MEKLLHGIDTVIVRVTDVQKAKAWYLEKLQLTSEWEDDTLRLVVLNTGGPTSLTLWQTDEKIVTHRQSSSYPIFKIMRAEEVRQTLLSRNVEVSELITDHAVTYFWFYDPDGNILEACEVHG